MNKTAWTLEDLKARRDDILNLAEQHGAYNVRVFGSIVRGEATSESDIDLLVSYRDGTSLWDAIGLWQDLQEKLGCEVSLVSEDIQNKRLLERILSEAIPL